MARIDLQLQPNEGIVLQNEDVARKLRRGHDDGTLILTTKNLYFYKGHGKRAEITILPLNQVKINNGQVQVMTGGSRSNPVLQVFMINGQEEFDFKKFSLSSNARKEIDKWVNSMQQLVLETIPPQPVYTQPVQPQPVQPQPVQSQPVNINIQTGPSNQPVNDAVTNQTDSIQKPEPEEPVITKVSGKCIGCRAPIFGNKGEMVRCKYCDTDQIL